MEKNLIEMEELDIDLQREIAETVMMMLKQNGHRSNLNEEEFCDCYEECIDVDKLIEQVKEYYQFMGEVDIVFDVSELYQMFSKFMAN